MIAFFVLTGALGAARLLAAWGTGSAGVLADGVHSAALAALCFAVTAAPRRLSGGLTLALSAAAFLAAVFVARRQYIPTQNGAANKIGNSIAILNCPKTSAYQSENTVAPAMITNPVTRPTNRYLFSSASGLMYAA